MQFSVYYRLIVGSIYDRDNMNTIHNFNIQKHTMRSQKKNWVELNHNQYFY